MRRLLALLAALALLLGAAACSSSDDDGDDATTEESTEESTEETTEDDGGEDESGDEQAFVDALAAGLLEDTDSGDPSPVSEGEAQCMAEAVVDTVGMDTIEEAGVTPEQLGEDGPSALASTLTDDQADGIAEGFVGCMESPGAFMVAAMGASPDATECIDENLDPADLQTFIALTLLAEEGSEPPAEVLAMFEALAEACPDAFVESFTSNSPAVRAG